MKCKQCGHRLKVVRTEEIGENVYRVRICVKCGEVVRTVEEKWVKAEIATTKASQ